MAMHHSIVSNGEKPIVARCTTCCKRFHCPLCLNFKPTIASKVHQHLEVHVKNAIAFKDTKICRCNLNCREGGHFHCPGCNRTIIRRIDMEGHLKVCQGSVHTASTSAAFCPRLPTSTSAPLDSSPSPLQLATSSPLLSPTSVCPSPALVHPEGRTPPAVSSVQSVETSTVHVSGDTQASSPHVSFFGEESKDHQSEHKKVNCPLCQCRLYRQHLTTHLKTKHLTTRKDITESSHLKSVCVDAANGISAVQRSGHGFPVPLHAQSKTWGHVHMVKCELEECRQYRLMASRSGLPFSHCEHIRSLEYCTETATEEVLEEDVLSQMVALKFFGETKKATCLKRQKTAQAAHAPLCVEVAFGMKTPIFSFSVYEPALHHYSPLGRVMVTYSPAANTWRCPCAKPSVSCLHINISKWHLFQTNRNVFTAEPSSSSTPPRHHATLYPPTAEDLKRLVRYIYNHKKLPAKLPDGLVKPKALTEYITTLHPKETVCTVCPGQVHLEQSTGISTHARIITMNGIIEDVSTYFRRCPQCCMIYRYQEWQDSLHNFDDHTVLNLEMCLYLRHNLQNSVSVSQVLDTLESLRKVKYPPRDTVLHAYCHFEALTGHNKSYSCVCRGSQPPVVVMDLHKKGVFNFPVGDVGVNMEEFSDSVELEMIARGFVQSMYMFSAFS